MLALVVVLIVLLVIALVSILVLSFRLTKNNEAVSELTEKNSELHALVHSSELKSLRYKLNPHLFKNALNSIQSHAYQTYYAMDKLSGVLDYVLYESEQSLVPLTEEMDFATNFIEINRLKTSPLFDLSVKNNIDPSVSAELNILPLVTVDLIENAFKHTDFQKNESFISITFQLSNGFFQIEVRNRISEKEVLRKRNSGMGLSTLKQRLEIAYPGKHVLLTQNDGNVFHSLLKLDLNA